MAVAVVPGSYGVRSGPRGMSIAVVSAAASGIGAATVRALLAAGWRVAAVDIDTERLSQLRTTWSIAGDARSVETWERVGRLLDVEGANQHLGLVAGVGGATFRASRELSDEEWTTAFELNLMTAVRAVRVLIPRLETAPTASIVTVGTLSARRMDPMTPAYCTSKAALEAWTSVLAIELAATGVRANCVVPGVTDTEGLHANLTRKGQTEADIESRAHQQPRGSLIKPAEVADAIAFLLSPSASGVTGESVVVDGGLSRRLPG